MVNLPETWQGTSPYFVLVLRDGEPHIIDVDERGWVQRHAELLRCISTWHLCSKEPQGIVFSIVIGEGEQAYYRARHFKRDLLHSGETQAHITAYGIGKRRRDGHTDSLWIFPTGQICAGDDVNIFGQAILARM